MTQLIALSLAIAVLGAVATWISLTSSFMFMIWIGFVAWAAFFHSGGDMKAFQKVISCGIWGAIVGWVAALIIVSVPVAALGNFWPAIVVGVTVFVLCAAAQVELLNVIPISVYGYACVFGVVLGNPGVNLTKAALTSPSFANALVVVVVSLVIGDIFGFLSGKLGGMLKSK
jgi:hypothetical protein